MIHLAAEIAERINAANETHYGRKANAWTGDNIARIYFGKDYVTIESNGEIHNRRGNKARAVTIGASGLELVEKYAK